MISPTIDGVNGALVSPTSGYKAGRIMDELVFLVQEWKECISCK